MPYGNTNLFPIPDDVPDEKALYLSDVIATSWHCVVDTGVKQGDVVAIWGGGPIGQMCAEFSFYHGASRVILIDGGDGAWRLDFVKSKAPKLETIDFTKLPKGESVTSKLKKMVDGGPDVTLECAAGEYAKGWAHYFELMLGMETDSSEILNEMITSVRPFGRVGVTGVYAGYVSAAVHLFHIQAMHLQDRQLDQALINMLTFLDESLQYWSAYGDGRSIYRKWPGTRAEILERTHGPYPGRKNQSARYGDPSHAP